MKPKTLPINIPTEIEVIDAIPTLLKVMVEGAKPPLIIHIIYLTEKKGK
jgi:hypothetical protein